MPRQEHTIIFVPHARARFRQFRVSTRALAFAGAAIVLSVTLGLTFSVLWLKGVRRGSELTALAEENRDLRARAVQLVGKLEAVEKQLTEFEERTRRLSIVAGLAGVHDAGIGGVGGLTAIPMAPEASVDASLSESARRGMAIASRLELVERKLASQADDLALTPTLAPVMGVLSAGYGLRADPFTGGQEFHPGLDISTPAGSRILAPAAATVVKVGWEKGYGRVILLSHGHGLTTLYGHLEATRVSEGQRVRRGDLIGLVGSTGRSTGPHLHYEVHVQGKPTNPLDYVLNAF